MTEKKKRGRKPLNHYYSNLKENNTNDIPHIKTIVNNTSQLIKLNITYDDILEAKDKRVKHIRELNEMKDKDEITLLEELYTKQKSKDNESIIFKRQINNKMYNVKLYNESFLEKVYSNITEFKEYTNQNIKCWWCRNYFENYPIGIPKSIKKICSDRDAEDYITTHKDKLRYIFCDNDNNNDKKKRRDIYEVIENNTIEYTFNVHGCFCSFNCCLSYCNENKIKRDYLKLMYKKLYNGASYNDIIKPAPHWQFLKEYGGTLTIDEFRHEFKCLNNIHSIYKYPMIYIPNQSEIHDLQDIHNKYIEDINKNYNTTLNISKKHINKESRKRIDKYNNVQKGSVFSFFKKS